MQVTVSGILLCLALAPGGSSPCLAFLGSQVSPAVSAPSSQGLFPVSPEHFPLCSCLSSSKHTTHWTEGAPSPTMTSLELTASAKTLCPNKATF